MRDLNDFSAFHAVVIHQGFSSASRATGIPKGTLSRNVARLEDALHVRLLDRTTRQLRLTEVGKAVFEQSGLIIAGAEAAEGVAAEATAEPNGLVRLSCPQGLIQNLVADILPGFMIRFPRVRVQVKVINRRADLMEDRIDLALRARTIMEADSSLVVRSLGTSHLILATSTALLASVPNLASVDQLSQMPTLSMADDIDEDSWDLVGPKAERRTIRHRPRMMCSNFDVLHAAAVAGAGVALLPEHICRASFAAGTLVRVLPEWHSPFGGVQVVFLSRKGMIPAVRSLIDYLATEVGRILAE